MSNFEKPIIFINYRRDDSENEARSINNGLENAFGGGFVFQDRDDLNAGAIWSEQLIKAGKAAKVIVAVIGPKWLQLNDEGKSRLFDKGDWVKKELELAIKQKKVIIPVLVNGGTLPSKTDIPQTLHQVLAHQAFELRSDKWNIDFKALIQDISKVSKTKTLQQIKKEEKEKAFRKKILLLTSVLIALSALFAWYLLNGKTAKTNGKEEVVFCPEFEDNTKVKTLLYPFAEVDNEEHSLENIVKTKITSICQKLNIQSEVKFPNIEQGQYFDISDAKIKCSSCPSDIFLTGISHKNAQGKYGFSAQIGFCDATFDGYTLDQDSLKINVSNSSIPTIANNHKIAGSLEYAIEIFLGVYKIKNGDLEEGIHIIEQAIKNNPENKKLELRASEILWQAQYKLDKKLAATQTLDRMYQIEQSKTAILIAKTSINIEEKRHDQVINDLNVAIEKTNNKKRKDLLIEKRGDTYFETKQYDKAQKDYKIIQSKPVDGKIRRTDAIIQNNKVQIGQLQAASNLTTAQRANLIDLNMQNGNTNEVARILESIDLSTINNAANIRALNLQPTTLQAIRNDNITLTPQTASELNRIIRLQPTATRASSGNNN